MLQENTYIRRVAESNYRFTQGAVYLVLNTSGRIFDDVNKKARPCMEAKKVKDVLKTYWEVVEVELKNTHRSLIMQQCYKPFEAEICGDRVTYSYEHINVRVPVKYPPSDEFAIEIKLPNKYEGKLYPFQEFLINSMFNLPNCRCEVSAGYSLEKFNEMYQQHPNFEYASSSLMMRGIRPNLIILDDPLNEYNQPEESKMLKIETVTLINGSDAKNLDVSNIIHHIKNEEQKIEKLNAIKSESKAIARLKKEHEANVEKLVKILDSME